MMQFINLDCPQTESYAAKTFIFWKKIITECFNLTLFR